MGFYSNSNVETRSTASQLDMAGIMRQVYIWLTLGLAVSFGVSFVVGNTGAVMILANPIVLIVSLIAYIVLSFALQPVIMRSDPTVGSLFYLLFTGVFGFMTSTIFLAYSGGTIAAAFIATAGMFGAMTVLGYTTKMDLSRFGSILIMALIGLILASLVNLFLRSEAIYWIVSYAGVLIFAGLTAYDTQWIKNNAAQIAMTGDRANGQRIALIGAFHLFLDFVNMFFFLLRILGNGRD
jgi:hypothetical protein